MQGYWILLIALGIPVGLFLFLKVADLIYGRKPTNLGIHNGKLAPMKETPKGVNSYTAYVSQKMEDFPYLGSKDEAVTTMVTILKNLKKFSRITFYELSPQNGYIWARDISLIMRWKDDIEFYFDDNNMVQFRSSPRYGIYDWGFNRKRMEIIRDFFLSIPSKEERA